MFNAFKLTKQLEQAGFTREQAESQIQMVTEIVEGDLATKQDIHLLRNDSEKTIVLLRHDMERIESSLRSDMEKMETSLRSDMEKMEVSIRVDMKKMEASLRHDMQQLENRIIIKLGTLFVIGFSTMITVMKFWAAG